MGLNEEQIANAMGICSSHCLPMGILDADKEENTLSRNTRFGFVSQNAIVACMMAKKGFTGPVRIVEGDSGFRKVILQGDMDLQLLVDFSGWRILKTRFKAIPANTGTQSYILATLAIVNENDIKPEEIAAVHIKTSIREARHTTIPAKKYPRNSENADHSAFYTNAIAIKERKFGPESYSSEKYVDPVVLELIDKITVEADPKLPEWSLQGTSEIITKDGRRWQKCVEQPHGFGSEPLSDRELEEKLKSLAEKYMSYEQVKNIFNTVWNLEGLDDMTQLTKLMIFKPRQ
jgi:2-methylcitrate dehydratase